jgi:hypothetical protein
MRPLIKNLALLLVISLILPVGLAVADKDDVDQAVVKAAMEKAKALKVNPIPVFVDQKGNLVTLPGIKINIRKGRWTLVTGDMLINVGSKPVNLGKDGKVGEVVLQKGEYIIVKEKEISKVNKL